LVLKNSILVSLVLYLVAASSPAAGQRAWGLDKPDIAGTVNLFVNGTSQNATLGGACVARIPCFRISDALIEARRLRAIGTAQKIHIHVATGTYFGTFHPGTGSETLEDLPILINIPNVTLEGTTVLGAPDGNGVPTCPDSGCYGSNVTTNDFADSGESLVLVAPTVAGGDVSDVVIRNLSLYYPAPSFGVTLGFDRVTDLLIEGNFVLNGTAGIFGRFSTVSVIGNVVRGGEPAFGATAGNVAYPTRAQVSTNRFEHAFVGSYLIGTTDVRNFYRLSPNLPFTLLPIDGSWVGNVVSGEFTNNAMNDNLWAGLRLMQMFNQTPDSPVPANGSIDVSVIGNTFFNNGRTGLSFDAGFSLRSRPESLTGRLRAILAHNQFAGNGSWPIVISFTRLDPVGSPNNLQTWKFLQASTYEFWDLDGELTSAHIVNPGCDPFLTSCSSPVPPATPGPALVNQLIIH
jgi:hypothetical protein